MYFGAFSISKQSLNKDYIMKELNDKYIARMLEGAEQGLSQVDAAIEQLREQLSQMEEQREEMLVAQSELKQLLGLSEEASEETPELLVEENVN